MKVGDLVRQNGKLVQFKGKRVPVFSRKIGIVTDIVDNHHQIPEKYTKWGKFLGRSVEVQWEDGTITASIAENSLDILNEHIEHEINALSISLAD